MTKEQRTFYLENNGGLCPYCKSDRLDAENLQADGLTAASTVRCDDCLKAWTDIYTLTDALEDEGDTQLLGSI